MNKWTPTVHGVSHLRYNPKRRWASVLDYGKFAVLSLWFPGCGFEPLEQTHKTTMAAKRAGRAWVESEVGQ
jgi:hypothetical protein